MTEQESLDIIRHTFSHVPIRRLELVDDPDFGRIAKLHVAESDLELALGENSANARQAAMASGFDVEVTIADD